MRLTFELGGWVLAIGAFAVASVARYRTTSLADAVARICHELRGPLTAARLGLNLAGRTGALEDVRLKAIELELSRATLVLEDLARVEPGATAAAWLEAAGAEEQVDVAALLADAVEASRGAAAAHGAELTLLKSDARPVLRGRRLRLAQAVCNLIANASEHGGGLVSVGCRVDSTSVYIEVVDDGAGLPAPVAELTRRRAGPWPVTRRWRSQSTLHRPGSRRGHGLAVASAIAAAHGGRLAAAPSECGARLVLELPLARARTLSAG